MSSKFSVEEEGAEEQEERDGWSVTGVDTDGRRGKNKKKNRQYGKDKKNSLRSRNRCIKEGGKT